MSHFTVLVIGDNVEEQLAPFHEFECTGTNDQFVQDIDVTDEVRQRMTGEDAESLEDALSYYGLESRIVSDESLVQKLGDECEHKYGFAVVQDGQLIKAVDRTNPNKRWDWWVVGGRWSGFLKLKPGCQGTVGSAGSMGQRLAQGANRADEARKGDIDFEGIRADAAAKADERWETARRLAAGQTWESWESVRTRITDIDAARKFYWEQPAIVSLKADPEKRFNWDINDDLALPKDTFVQLARDQACCTWALLKDGQWSEKGKMGWWAMSTDNVDPHEWNRKFNELLDSLPDDTLITLVDCHI